MSKYDIQLQGLTPAEIISRLEGPSGLLAVSSRELFYIDDTAAQTARLSSIKRIGVNKETGKVEVSGESGTLMEIAPRAFQKDELKGFLESLKGHVLRAKSMPTEVAPAAPAQAAEPAPPSQAEEPAPRPRFSDPQTLEEEPPLAVPDHLAELQPPVPQPDPALNIIEPPRTLPDEPSDSIWAYEGAPKTEPGHKPVAAEPPAPKPATENLTIPPPPYAGPANFPTRRGGMVWLKVWALVTLVFVLGYLYAYFTSLLPAGSVWTLLEVVVFGVGLAGIQWRLSDPL